ncbi:MAG TPA: DNA-3-methyladenine glycosylase [Streptosporangiaceae bacterium]|nr:DNA-3-methyladenine glycosylase [Streptosporangiaceae bacterium]
MDLLPREFFDRPSTEVAPDLLGCVLWHDSPAGLVAVRLVEVEAYQGASDPASHAYRGQTARNAVMFGPPGHMYVYFTYGMHWCANLVCQPPGQAEAVLLRAGEVVAGSELAARRRAGQNGLTDFSATGNGQLSKGRAPRAVDLARGPARLCQALDIDRRQDGADVCEPGSPLGIGPALAAEAAAAGKAVIRTGPRVGISQAADRPWRYWLAGDGHVSVYRPSKPRAPRPKPVTGSGAEDGTMHR